MLLKRLKENKDQAIYIYTNGNLTIQGTQGNRAVLTNDPSK